MCAATGYNNPANYRALYPLLPIKIIHENIYSQKKWKMIKQRFLKIATAVQGSNKGKIDHIMFLTLAIFIS